MKNYNPRWIFGFGLLVLLSVLAIIIALGRVEQQTSYGLQIVLGSLSTLSGGFATWAFSEKKEEKKDE